MTQQNFIERRSGFWNEFEKVINGNKKIVKSRAAWFPPAWREITQDLNTARSHAFDPSIIERLNRLVLEGNQLLYGQRSWSIKIIIDFITKTFPRAIRSQWRGLGAASLIFWGLALFFGFLCVRFPAAVYEFIPESQAVQMEEMYNPESYHFLHPRDVGGDADMFGYYIYNNVAIAFRTFAGGILAGFGSLLILCFNGAFMGVIAAHIINQGFSEPFFSFVIGHGSFELTAIVLSAQAGLLLGYSFFVTKGRSRAASIRAAGKTALPLITGSTIMLVIAAVIEAFWSSRHQTPSNIRFIAGGAGWILLYSYFIFAGREKKEKKR
ncbi:hypothetical protein AGMMS49928_16880 [Spirochaetia bacterium]|nr:hypothetical protein AGMMS49928_16880 [Spirochaetia bacterium]